MQSYAPRLSFVPSAVLARPFSTDAAPAADATPKQDISEITPPLKDGEYPPHIENLVAQLLKLNNYENTLLMNLFQKKLGLSDADVSGMMNFAGSAPAAQQAGGAEDATKAAAEAPKVEEKKAFSLVMTKVGDKKVAVMKEIRTLTNLSLKDVQTLASVVPAVVGKDLDKEKAEKWAEVLKEAGATVKIE